MPHHARIEFWFDFTSTYSYPAAMRVEALAGAHGVAVDWRPFLLGPVFRRIGWDGPPLFVHQAKADYVWRDLARRCRVHGLPFRRPSVAIRSGRRLGSGNTPGRRNGRPCRRQRRARSRQT